MSQDLDQPGKKANMYSERVVQEALESLALNGGNTRQTSKELAEKGIKHPYEDKPIPRKTLDGWMRLTHREKYLHLRDVEMPHIYAKHRDTLHQRFIEHDENEKKANELLAKALDEETIDPRDLSGAMRNIAVAKKLDWDQMRVADELPSNYTQQEDISSILRALQAEGMEIPKHWMDAIDAEVIEPEQLDAGA